MNKQNNINNIELITYSIIFFITVMRIGPKNNLISE